MNPAGLLFVAMGIFALCGAGLDWNWFMNHRKARFLVWIFGRNGARLVYGLVGCLLIVLGALLTLGIIKDNRRRASGPAPMGAPFGAAGAVAWHQQQEITTETRRHS